MAELLLELFSEEIPARMQARAVADLKRLITDRLSKAGLKYSDAQAYVTPRRLVLVVDGLPAAQPDVREERKGPRVGAPDKAVQGFLGSVGLTLDQLETRETPKGDFHFAVIEKRGRPSAEVLAELLPDAIAALPWPKSMRWGAYPGRWVRPLHRILALFDGAIVNFAYAHLNAGDLTSGHRFMAPEMFVVTGFADYKAKLHDAKVMLDAADRRALIKAEAERLAAAEGLSLKPDEALLDEVAGLVEWPVPLVGAIDQAFMEVPAEVLTTAMRSHQKYFSVETADGKLAPRFVLVANLEAPDGGTAIARGNERVLTARLADAKFFWDQDRKATLASRAPALAEIVFHAKLGTLDQKMDRVQALAVAIADQVPGADKDRVRSAARLAKADLSTGMVGEFPELQGIMGRYYATHDGEHAEVAAAIAEHYSPLGPNDACPTAPVSVAVALADKIDTLVGFWAIDEKPTGSKDPFALRRAALGVIRLIIENGLRLNLLQVFGRADAHATQERAADLLGFFADRLKVHLREQGVRHDLVSAVFALGGEDDLVRLLARVEALAAFLDTEDGANLLTAYKRAANILRIEEKKDGRAYDGQADPARFDQDEEKRLAEQLAIAGNTAEAAIEAEDFAAAMAAMASLRDPVDGFFDHVTVNAEDADLRENRLRLLSRIRGVLDRVADFSEIEG